MTAGAVQVSQWLPAGADRSSEEGRSDGGTLQSAESSVASTRFGAVDLQQVDWLDEHHHAVSAMLMQRGFVPLYPQLVAASGSVKAALMLGQAIGLSRTWLQRDKSRNGWFWMNAADWTSATGLSAREQESARESLVAAGLWEERRTHNPSRLYFRVHLSAVSKALGLTQNSDHDAAVDAETSDVWQWRDSPVANLLSESLMFFKPLADLAGGVMAGLVLSQLLARQRAALRLHTVDAQGRFPIHFDKMADQMLMGQKSMRNAREQLRRAGFIVEHTIGSGPSARIHVGVNLSAMMACLQLQPTTAMRDRIAAARLGRGAADRQRPIAPPAGRPSLPTIADNRQFESGVSVRQMSLIDFPFTNDQGLASDSSTPDEGADEGVVALLSIAKKAATPPPVDNVAALLSIAEQSACPFVESDGALLSTAYTENKYRETTTTESSTPSVDNSGPWSSRFLEPGKTEEERSPESNPTPAKLIVPAGIDPVQAERIVGAAPAALRQTLLDELAGHMQSKRKAIDSPAGYLHVLTRRVIDGSFVATVALDVAQLREARAVAAARETLPAVVTPAPAEPDDSDRSSASSEAATAARSKLRELRSQIASRAIAGSPAKSLAPTITTGGGDDV